METTDLTTEENTMSGMTATSEVPPATGSSNINISNTERIISSLGGAALAILALRNPKSAGGIGMLLAGSFLLTRGISGYCAISNALGRNTSNKKASAMEVNDTIIINKPVSEVYAYWRQLENLPNFMRHVEKVETVTDTKSKWSASVPGGIASVSWEAEITDDMPNERIRWSSLPGSTVDNAGEVQFRETGNAGTEISTRISYRLPAGDLGGIAAKLFSPVVESMMKEDLRRFKDVLESGETTSSSETAQPKRKPGRKKGSGAEVL